MLRRRALLGIKSGGALPAEYQEVEYLQSTGTSASDTPYIDTGVKPTSSWTLKGKVRCVSSSAMFASVQSGVSGGGNIIRIDAETTFQYCSNASASYKAQMGSIDTNWHEFQTSGRSIIWDSTTYTISGGSACTSQSYNLWLFADNKGGSINPNIGSKSSQIAYFQIYDANNILVRNFIPCYRKADGVAGMYDTVNEVFYTNAGSGTFTIGQNVGSDGLYILQDGILRNGFTMQTYRGSFTYYSGEVLGLRGTSLLGTNTVVLGNEKLDLSSYRYLRGRGCSSGSSASDFYLAISPTSSTATPIYNYFNWTDWNIVTLDLANYASGNYRLNTGTSDSRARLRDVWLTNTLTA